MTQHQINERLAAVTNARSLVENETADGSNPVLLEALTELLISYDWMAPTAAQPERDEGAPEHTHETGGAWHVTRWTVPGCPACAQSERDGGA